MIQNKQKGLYFQVFLACLSLFALGWMDNARGPFFPLFLDATEETASRGAYFFALASFVAILSSASAGFIIKRYGLKFLLYMGGVFMALSPLGLILEPNLKGALLTALFFGLSLGWVAVGQNALIGRVKKIDLRQRLFALLHCFYALSAMTAPLTVVYLKGIVPWNYILLGVTVILIPFLILLFFFKDEAPNLKEALQKNALDEFNIEIVLWIAFMSFYIGAELILSTRLVVLMQSFELSFDKSSQYLFIFFLSMFLVRLAFFFVKIKFSQVKVIFTGVFLGVVFFILGYTVHPLFIALIGGLMGPVFPLVMNLLSEQWPEVFDILVARVISISSFFVVMAHIAVGKMTDVLGVHNSLQIIPLFLIMSCFIITLIGLHRRKK